MRPLRLFGPFERLIARAAEKGKAAFARLGLHDPIVLAESDAMASVLALAVTIWWHQDLIRACIRYINYATPEQLLPLAPGNFNERMTYRIFVNVLLLLSALGLFRVLKLRRGQRTKRGLGAVALTVAVFVVVVLMHAFPYRILFQNAAEKVSFAGDRCYVLGEDGAELLIYCPDTDRPHNRVVRRTMMQKLGVTESIFTPAH